MVLCMLSEYLLSCLNSDGVIKWWDLETGQLTFCVFEHIGMITQLLYWVEPKLLFSSSNDGTIVVWTIGATVFDRITV